MGRISALTEVTELASNDYFIVLDSSANIAKKVSVANAFGLPEASFTASGESWTYASATTITVPTDATLKYGVGMVIKITQSTGGTKYGTIIDVDPTLLTIKWRNGATLANEAITSPYYTALATPLGAGPIQPDQWTNPYRASVYSSTSPTLTANVWTKAPLNTENYDTNGDFNTSTNRYVAPFDGVYLISAQVAISSAGMNSGTYGDAALYKNGASILGGQRTVGTGNANTLPKVRLDCQLQLAAGDYIELYGLCSDTSRNIVGGSGQTILMVSLITRV